MVDFVIFGLSQNYRMAPEDLEFSSQVSWTNLMEFFFWSLKVQGHY